MTTPTGSQDSPLDPGLLKKRATYGLVILTLRRFLLQFVNLFGGIALARILTPEIFGVFAIVTFVVGFLAGFAELGLGAALIQKKELQGGDLETTFTIQQGLAFLFFLALSIGAPLLIRFYGSGLTEETVWLLRVLGFSLFISGFRTIPSILLERQLLFDRLVLVEVVEVLIYQGLAVGLALLGLGVWALTFAVLLRSVTGAILLYSVSPWRPRLAWVVSSVKNLVIFGAPFQLNGFLTTIKDNVVPTLVAFVSGSFAVGLINWSNQLVSWPGQLVGVVARVAFPTYSRLQEDMVLLKTAIEKTLWGVSLLLFPGLLGIAALAPWIIKYVYGEKWAPAEILIYWLVPNHLIGQPSSLLIASLYALGRVSIALKLVVFWTILTWALSIPLVLKVGYVGAVIASFLVSLTSFLTLREVRKVVKVDVISPLWKNLLAAFLMAIALRMVAPRIMMDLVSLLVLVGLGGIFYFAIVFLLDRERILNEARLILLRLRPSD